MTLKSHDDKFKETNETKKLAKESTTGVGITNPELDKIYHRPATDSDYLDDIGEQIN